MFDQELQKWIDVWEKAKAAGANPNEDASPQQLGQQSGQPEVAPTAPPKPEVIVESE